jgi:hypothetical protein
MERVTRVKDVKEVEGSVEDVEEVEVESVEEVEVGESVEEVESGGSVEEVESGGSVEEVESGGSVEEVEVGELVEEVEVGESVEEVEVGESVEEVEVGEEGSVTVDSSRPKPEARNAVEEKEEDHPPHSHPIQQTPLFSTPTKLLTVIKQWFLDSCNMFTYILDHTEETPIPSVPHFIPVYEAALRQPTTGRHCNMLAKLMSRADTKEAIRRISVEGWVDMLNIQGAEQYWAIASATPDRPALPDTSAFPRRALFRSFTPFHTTHKPITTRGDEQTPFAQEHNNHYQRNKTAWEERRSPEHKNLETFDLLERVKSSFESLYRGQRLSFQDSPWNIVFIVIIAFKLSTAFYYYSYFAIASPTLSNYINMPTHHDEDHTWRRLVNALSLFGSSEQLEHVNPDMEPFFRLLRTFRRWIERPIPRNFLINDSLRDTLFRGSPTEAWTTILFELERRVPGTIDRGRSLWFMFLSLETNDMIKRQLWFVPVHPFSARILSHIVFTDPREVPLHEREDPIQGMERTCIHLMRHSALLLLDPLHPPAPETPPTDAPVYAPQYWFSQCPELVDYFRLYTLIESITMSIAVFMVTGNPGDRQVLYHLVIETDVSIGLPVKLRSWFRILQQYFIGHVCSPSRLASNKIAKMHWFRSVAMVVDLAEEHGFVTVVQRACEKMQRDLFGDSQPTP